MFKSGYLAFEMTPQNDSIYTELINYCNFNMKFTRKYERDSLAFCSQKDCPEQ